MKTRPVEAPCYILDEEDVRAVTYREFIGEWSPRNKDKVVIASTEVGEVTVTTFWAHRDLREWKGTLIPPLGHGLSIWVAARDVPAVGAAAGPAVWCTVVHDDDRRLAFHAHAAYATREEALKGHEEVAHSPPPVRRHGPAQLTHESVHEYLASTGIRNEPGDRFRCRLCVAPPCTRTAGHQWEPLDEPAAFYCTACGCEVRP